MPVSRFNETAGQSGNGSPVTGANTAVVRGRRPPASRRVTVRRARRSFMKSRSLGVFVLLGLAGIGPLASPAGAGPEGQMVLAQTISIAARWFDPAEAEGIITPYIFYYALHDALVKPLPGNPVAPCLAESWSASADGLSYEFVLRKGARFHNGEPVTAEDVKFSFERYKG